MGFCILLYLMGYYFFFFLAGCLFEKFLPGEPFFDGSVARQNDIRQTLGGMMKGQSFIS